MSTENFLDAGYEAPSSGGYSKIESGSNKFRILSRPLMLWVLWGGNKNQRIPYNKDQKPAMPAGENPSVKHAWAMVVWNYQTNQVEVMELDKMTLINPLLTHIHSPSWGNPMNYDVVFNKSGSGKSGTTYTFTAIPPAPLTNDILAAQAETPVDLTQLLVENGNPFISASAPVQTQAAPIQAAPAGNPFPPQDQAATPEGNPFPPQTPNKAF